MMEATDRRKSNNLTCTVIQCSGPEYDNASWRGQKSFKTEQIYFLHKLDRNVIWGNR